MLRLLQALSLATLCISCGPPAYHGGGSSSQRGGTSCVVDTECNPGQTCSNGACVDASGCRADADCAAGQMCTNGECVGAQSSCQDLRDCVEGEICENKKLLKTCLQQE